jgi:hypothetical protein
LLLNGGATFFIWMKVCTIGASKGKNFFSIIREILGTQLRHNPIVLFWELFESNLIKMKLSVHDLDYNF